ncbi:MAG: low molecular weight protein-tyrosine-phosphatase [Lentimicrobium sp.]|jgi:protein-tyrosine phosphatase|nr:low molecular weight protein-tyrosine-phosphatase [Lentimicrobium sp.]
MVKILMVCLGNICRSPLAEGVMRKKLEDHHIEGIVDSCGFEAFHVGDTPDERSINVAREHDIDIKMLKARLFVQSDFDRFDRIYVMDRHNMMDVAKKARNKNDLNKIDFIMNAAYPGSDMRIPDPYMGGLKDFEKVWEMVDLATEKIIDQIKTNKFITK